MKPPIGLIDSGIGGLSLLKALVPALPGRQFVYLADNANVPFGNRSAPELQQIGAADVRFLLRQGVSCVVLACNTLTAAAAEPLRKVLSLPIVGVEPALRPAARAFPGEIGVLATCATLRSEKFRHLACAVGCERFRFLSQPRLAECVERLFATRPDRAVTEGLEPLPEGLSALVLGCTHYSLVRDQIRTFAGLPVLDGTEGTVRRVLRFESPDDSCRQPGIDLFVTRAGTLPTYRDIFAALGLLPFLRRAECLGPGQLSAD